MVIVFSRCSSTCTIEVGWACPWDTIKSISECYPVCGNKIITSPQETCDDGNLCNGDGCSSGCQIEKGWTCSVNAAGYSTCTEICGDGLNLGQHQCDDGNLIDGDGCDHNCNIEPGWECEGGCSSQADVCEPIVQTPSLAECQAFAAQFENTCNSHTPCNFHDGTMNPTRVVCQNDDGCPGTHESCSYDDGHGNKRSGNCHFNRQLCVTCFERQGARWIRVQTNSFPSYCFRTDVPPQENNIDFEVYFNPVFRDPSPLSINTIAVLDNQVCTWNWPLSDAPQGHTCHSGNTHGVVGVSFSGVPIFGGSGENNRDAFYPHPVDGNDYVGQMDNCLGHVTKNNPFYHHYSFSPCMQSCAQRNSYHPKKCSDDSNCRKKTSNYMITGVDQSQQVVGIALDGRLIYGPWRDSHNNWSPCDVDVCNGVYVNGVYSYAMTDFHPYSIGCWGPGNVQTIAQGCSSNPKRCQK